MTCAACGTENRPGRKFCAQCGSSLALPCPSCGAANEPGERFCGECGTALTAAAATTAAAAPSNGPVAERRLVTVLFADLVGFTAASEGRDAEDTRELLSRYFDLARTTIERYGGTVEKFIGDAVMAVWGAPVAQEDDAERAVRTALDLVAAVGDLDPSLRARAGVLTGEAAVTIGAEGQGMVAGDLVNTASRIQSAAEPGTVLVGDATKRASEAAVAYADAGTHALKGKVEPVQLWQALRVVAGARGALRSAGLEAPFVGRDRELRTVKELFHATADDGRARVLSVVGTAGIGKSRLVWEFFKYIDGLEEQAWWHKGRCLAYGEGVAYWALAEMVRMRARIADDDPTEEALTKLRNVLAEIVPDEDERSFVEPRLQHLLGLTERTAPDREDLFSAWRLFVERMADQFPVIMVFEDLQWADAALVEFLDYLLDWSRNHPVYVVTMARPELADRHVGWGSKARSFTSLALDPLSDDAIDALLRGLAPGLPDDAVAHIRERADGIPLYAVETVRMLLDRGLLEPGEAGYRVVGDLGSLDVPETLHALIAARLDGLDPAERQLLQDAAVLGKTFAPAGLGALSGATEDTVAGVLASLVRKEMLVLDSDPRSPERGQYGFLQALVQRVAYESLARRDRKAKHLAAAGFLARDSGLDPDEIAEVVAAHTLDAFRAAPDDPDATEIKAEARTWLMRAAERAASLAATDDAQRTLESAVALADEPLERARLLERVGKLALTANRIDQGQLFLREALELCDAAGATHERARVAAALGGALWQRGNAAEALELLEGAFVVLAEDERDADVAALAAELARIHYFTGNLARAGELIDVALDVAEDLRLPGILSRALNTKSLIVERHWHEADALMRQALRIALEHDLVADALRAYNNLVVLLDNGDRAEEVGPLLEDALAMARRRGDRFWEVRLGAALLSDLRVRGRWDDVDELAGSMPVPDRVTDHTLAVGVIELARIAADRGDAARAAELIAHIDADGTSPDLHQRHLHRQTTRLAAELAGDLSRSGESLAEEARLVVQLSYSVHTAQALNAALRHAALTGDHAPARAAAEAVEALPEGMRTRAIDSQLFRARARLAADDGDDAAAADAFAVALANARNLGYAYWLASVLEDYGLWLAAHGRAEDAAPLLDEARALYADMGAVACLERMAPPAASVAPLVEASP
jgi:class 3 adenylate cyclase/tetratricopeptide (TPR) repeat protein